MGKKGDGKTKGLLVVIVVNLTTLDVVLCVSIFLLVVKPAPSLHPPPFFVPLFIVYPLLFYVCFLTPFMYFHFTAYVSLSYLFMFVVLSFSLRERLC